MERDTSREGGRGGEGLYMHKRKKNAIDNKQEGQDTMNYKH